MTFAVLRALHGIIGEALGDIEAVYTFHGLHGKPPSGLGRDKASNPDPSGNYCGPARPKHRPTLSVNSLSNVYASPPPSPCIKTENSTDFLPQQSLDFPSLDAPCNPTSLSEILTHHPDVLAAVNRIIAACGQMCATVQTPFLTLCDAIMGYHLPSCMRLFEASHVPEILREAGSAGLHVNYISEKNGVDKTKLAHILRLLATHHVVRELSPDVFALNRISSTIDTGKNVHDLHQWTMEGAPEKKYEGTSGIAAFVGLCSDEIYKSSAYLTETYLLSQSDITRTATEPTRAPFCFAFGTVESKTGFFGWLEGSTESKLTETASSEDARVQIDQSAPVKDADPHVNRLRATSFGPGLTLNAPNANRFRLERFGKAMSGTSSWEVPSAILNSFDWHTLPRGSVIVDVGGGIGSTSMLLASAFSSHGEDSPSLRFIIQDRPIVVEMGEKAWRAKCPEFLESGTALFQVHDFFAPQPVKQAAIFLLRVVLHDWPDDFARRILLHLREAAMPHTKLLLGDFILPLACPDEVGGNELLEDIQGTEAMLAPPPLLPNLGKASANAYWMDMTMQVMFNAQERTLREIVVLAASAGWKVTRVTKSIGSLFGYIIAVPSTIPFKYRFHGSKADSYQDPAFVSHKSSEESKATVPITIRRGDKHNEREFERSSSRCGTPTFGSRMQLSLVEETLSKFGGSFFRSRKGTTTRTVSSPKSTSLKQAITLTPVPAAKKKSSPLSVPSLVTPTSPVSPTTKAHSSPKPLVQTLSQRIIPRRLSFANLRVNHEPVPPLPTPREFPSPLPPDPSLLSKTSLSHLSTFDNRDQFHLAASASSTACAQERKLSSKEHMSNVSPLPTLRRPGGEGELPQFHLPSWDDAGQLSPTRNTGRRSSFAQSHMPPASPKIAPTSPLPVATKVESRKRTKSVAGLSSKAGLHAANAVAFVSGIGASLGNGLEGRIGTGSGRLGGLLARSGGGTNIRSEKGRDVATSVESPEFSSFVDLIEDCRDEQRDPSYGSISVLAAAARIEKRALRKRGSP